MHFVLEYKSTCYQSTSRSTRYYVKRARKIPGFCQVSAGVQRFSGFRNPKNLATWKTTKYRTYYMTHCSKSTTKSGKKLKKIGIKINKNFNQSRICVHGDLLRSNCFFFRNISLVTEVSRGFKVSGKDDLDFHVSTFPRFYEVSGGF